MKKLSLLAASLLAIAAFNGCNDAISSDEPIDNLDKIDLEFSSHTLALQKADSCDDYRNHLLDSVAKQIADERFGAHLFYIDEAINYAEADDAGAAKSEDSTEKAGDYTTTNVQEVGADELDTVKNDGTYMYTLQDRKLHIAKIWPAESMEEIATLDFPQMDNGYSYPAGIMLDNDKLITLEYSYSWKSDSTNQVTIKVYDVANPAKPELKHTHTIDGYLEDARLIQHRLFVVSSANVRGDWYDLYKLSEEDIPGVPRFESPFDDPNFKWSDWSDEAWEEYEKQADDWYSKRKENLKTYLPIIRSWLDKKYPTINDFDWPQYSDGNTTRDALSCQDLYLPSTTSQKSGLSMVSEFSGDNFENFKAYGVADDGWLVYASTENLYLVSNSYNWWCDDEDDENNSGYSHIHHFKLGDDAGGLKYINSGEVEGYVTDQFWMSDYNDHLRVVSSYSYWGNSSKGHKLTVLDNSNTSKTMTPTGSVEGFGKDERLYSARMIGDKGFVVTYKNTDPLFTFDLSNPANPKLAGELKINGYSSYIHPVGDTHLLTIGEDADDNGNTLGMKLELFDISDMANPKSESKIFIHEEENSETGSSYGWSDAMYDHHAFNFHEASGLLAIPVNISKWTYTNSYYDWHYKHFTGMFIYRIQPGTTAPFEFVGGVDHSELVNNENHWWTNLNRARFYFKDKGVYDKNAYVYTISNNGIMANDANKPDNKIKAIQF